MAIARQTEPITEDDAFFERAVLDAFLPALLPALAHATGDLALLRDSLRPPGIAPGVAQGGMTEEQQEEGRRVAVAALRVLRDRRERQPEGPIADMLQRITAWMTGSPAADDYIPLLLEELAASDQDARAPRWRKDPSLPFNVAIIGAGMSGILAAIRLRQAQVPFVILEKNADVGGTWLENTYPGARVDVSNAFYSYSFAQKVDWPKHFSTQDVLLEYFRDCALEYGIRDQIRFRTEVLGLSWDEERALWSLRLRTAEGAEETLEANAVISAVGQLNRPRLPAIPGIPSFEGPSFHSARWDHGVDLRGKRVAVIGTGASAAQFIPEIADEVTSLAIFQRTPNWFAPVPHYHDDVPEGLRWLYTHVPYYVHWYRFWLFWNTTDGMLPAAIVDEDWDGNEHSVSAENDRIRALFTAYIESQFGDRPDLLAKVLPTYPPASKRIVIDNGIWARTLKQEHVQLITTPVGEITPGGVRTADGEEHASDVIIFGTGFQASNFLAPMEIRGRGGRDLHEQWQGDARAYLGVTVPGFPNLFLLYGPNTNIVVNGSIIYFSECEVRYVLGCLETLFTQGKRAMDCRRDIHDAYNERIDAANLRRVWGVSSVNSWYKSDSGRVAQNWPFNLIEYWQLTREADPGDYEYT